MAAPTTVQKGLDYTLSISGGTEIGGGTNATLTLSQELSESTNKSSSAFKSSQNGTRSWSVDFEGMYIESSVELAGDSLDFKVGSSSGTGGVSVKGIREITLDLSSELIGSVSSTTGLDRAICPATRTVSMTINGEWYDFDKDLTPTGGDEALEDLFDEIQGTTSSGIECTLTFGASQKIYATLRPTAFTLEHPHNDIITYSVTLEATGAVTAPTTTGADSGVVALLTDFFTSGGAAEVGTALLSTGTTDATEYTGSAYPESLSLSIPYTGVIALSGTLQGSGALTMQATT